MINMSETRDGSVYVPYDQRTGGESIVYFTRDLSAAGLKKAYEKVNSVIHGNIAIKLHTGEKNGPNILPRPWVEELIKDDIPGGTIVETNTYYEGDRYTTEQHRETLKVNGWTFCPVDIMDADGTANLPVKGGKWFDHMSVGKDLLIMIRLWFSPISRVIPRAASADPIRILVSAVLTAALVKP